MISGRSDRRIMVISGEASGDLHGANLVRELKILDSSLIITGVGGVEMAKTGMKIYYDIADLAVMGLVEILARLKVIKTAMNLLEDQFRSARPDLLILIDYPGFNLELARRAKKYNIPVLYYISPKVWAWREGRIKRIKKYVDRMAVILPFEKKYYMQHGVNVDFVGNPLLDQVKTTRSSEEFKSANQIDPAATVIGIMPGSRRQEIARLLPLFLQTAKMLNNEIENCVFLLPMASTLTEKELQRHGVASDSLDIRIISNERYEAMAACDAALAASGTLTMELAILGVAMVVCYRVSMLSYWLAKSFIKVKYASLVNLVAGKAVVPELLQSKATPENIFREMLSLLTDKDKRVAMQRELASVCEQLGEPGASRRTAELAFRMLTGAGREQNV